jgi:hypothetical protein
LKPNPNLKLLVIGHARHGKDTVADMMCQQYGLRAVSSSWFLAERVVQPFLANKGITYASIDQCFADRANRRADWYDAVKAFNNPDLTALGRAIWAENDIYIGLRNRAELHANRNAATFDIAIWVDRSDHLPPEDRSSMTLEPWMADFVLDNNRGIEDLRGGLQALMWTLGYVGSKPDEKQAA